MPVNFGSLSVANAFVGDKAVSAMYLGDTQVYPNEENAAGDIQLRIQTPDDATDLTFRLFNYISTTIYDDGWFVAVDWGDGSSDRYDNVNATSILAPKHTYAESGEYIVKITGSKIIGIAGFEDVYPSYTDWVREILSFKMPSDSPGVELYETFRCCYDLTGTIPEWDEKITAADRVYWHCIGLTGSIPAWGANITQALNTYYYCTGLESCSAELLENPMPSTITVYGGTVLGCVDAIRQHFTEAWGGTKAA